MTAAHVTVAGRTTPARGDFLSGSVPAHDLVAVAVAESQAWQQAMAARL
jgi:hypothetical protein